jgi:hypothetical protein
VDESLDHMACEEFLKLDGRLDGHDRAKTGDQRRIGVIGALTGGA